MHAGRKPHAEWALGGSGGPPSYLMACRISSGLWGGTPRERSLRGSYGAGSDRPPTHFWVGGLSSLRATEATRRLYPACRNRVDAPKETWRTLWPHWTLRTGRPLRTGYRTGWARQSLRPCWARWANQAGRADRPLGAKLIPGDRLEARAASEALDEEEAGGVVAAPDHRAGGRSGGEGVHSQSQDQQGSDQGSLERPVQPPRPAAMRGERSIGGPQGMRLGLEGVDLGYQRAHRVACLAGASFREWIHRWTFRLLPILKVDAVCWEERSDRDRERADRCS